MDASNMFPTSTWEVMLDSKTAATPALENYIHTTIPKHAAQLNTWL